VRWFCFGVFEVPLLGTGLDCALWRLTVDRVYIFYESGGIRVPLFGFYEGLRQRLKNTGVGVWDDAGCQYVVERSYMALIFKHVFCDLPYIEVWKDSAFPVLVNGFLERPWPARRTGSPAPAGRAVNVAAAAVTGVPDARYAQHTRQVLRDSLAFHRFHRLDDAKCLADSIALPDQFSESWQEKLEAELRSRKYSLKTVRSYVHYNRAICRTLQKKPEAVTAEDIKRYLAYLDKDRDLSSSSMNLAISAFKFFYGWVLRKNIAREQHRPHQDKRLPAVLAKSDMKLLLACEKNPKHRLLLMLAYSSGLRVSEVVVLRRDHIDLSRKTVLIRSGKGRKDRYTLLSDRAAAFVKDYCALYAIEDWLFPGQGASAHLSVRSAQSIFDKALDKAGIQKPGLSIHSLRHTFATHLMENGTDIKYIQELLGHASLRTTERYTHVARRDVLRIQSPLDSLDPDA
jgi:site-specific recombinase XerD